MPSSPTRHLPSGQSSVSGELRAADRDRIVAILREHGVLHASIFGSFARGDQHAASDVDLLVDLPVGASLFDLSRLALALEDALGRPFDLVTSFARLHPLIQDRIRKEEVILLRATA